MKGWAGIRIFFGLVIFGFSTTMVFAKSTFVLAVAGMGHDNIALFNTETDQVIKASVDSLKGWPGGTLQHVWITPDAKTIYGSIDSAPSNNGSVVVFHVEKYNWEKGMAKIKILKTLTLVSPGTLAAYPRVYQVGLSQPIPDWTQQKYTQAHGPSFHPSFNFTYTTQWTDNRIRAINTKTNMFIEKDPLMFAQESRQTHGVNFNPSGMLALGTGYYYESNKIDVYKFHDDGSLSHDGSILLGDDKSYAAFTHYTSWIDDKMAYTATMQFGPTSLTPKGTTIIGPSVWLLDVVSKSAKMVVGTASHVNDGGVYRSASDLLVVGSKLYIAEEDTIDDNYGDDGYVSVFDISDIEKPTFIKRFMPRAELPEDFTVAHGLTVTPDGKYIYAASYASKYIIKIDTVTDKVLKVFSGDDHGLMMPHGGFISGATR